MKPALTLITMLLGSSAIAQQTRQLDAHEHGVGVLNIAIEGTSVAIEFHAPGADIVGFEYAATNATDRAAIDAAVAMLARPLDLFVVPADAECSVTRANAGLESEEEQGAHADGDAHDSHDDHDNHDDDTAHSRGAAHTEFHAQYMLTCANPTALSTMTFAYFDAFANAAEVEVQVVTGSGAQAFVVKRDAPSLDLRSLF